MHHRTLRCLVLGPKLKFKLDIFLFSVSFIILFLGLLYIVLYLLPSVGACENSTTSRLPIHYITGFNGLWSNRIVGFDFDTKTWQTLTAPLARRRDARATTFDGGKLLYITGGFYTDPMRVTDSLALSDINIYDVRVGHWLETASMQTPRAGHAVTASDRYVYTLGGFDRSYTLYTQREEPNVLCSAEVIDPQTQKVTPLANMSIARRFLAAGWLGGELYAVGGWELNSVEKYNPTTG